jgi:hypothetical protein
MTMIFHPFCSALFVFFAVKKTDLTTKITEITKQTEDGTISFSASFQFSAFSFCLSAFVFPLSNHAAH